MILCLVESDNAKPSDLALEVLTLARRLAAQSNVALEAVAFASAEPLAERLRAFGVSTVHTVTHERLADYAPEAWAQCLVQLCQQRQPQALLAAGSERGNEVLAHVGALMRLPMAANCTDVQIGDPYRVTRQRWGGSLLEEAHLNGAVKLLTAAPHALAAEPAASASPLEIQPFTPTLSDTDLRVRVARRVEPSAGKVSLADARVVVGGGRGVGSAEGFRLLEELAALLDGAVGGSRVVTNLGWRPHTDQVGQTGTRIAPDLYIACGISGAIQHMVGCKGAKRLLVINTDRDAPIVGKADYAVIGDLHQVIPSLITAIRQARTNNKEATHGN
ncbi:MAG: electron transfer flavoprotein subunit alpha/FixB family protein [Chloroflexi bacterium]|nr:MAG: electron transfer flavoprotein subunit alpha/FixB family protein [Chloroflexota bacterium]